MSTNENLREFSAISAAILTTAFSNFPIGSDIDFNLVAQSMGLKDASAKFESGRVFSSVAGHALKWLSENGYVRAAGVLPKDRVTITDKGLAAMGNKSPLSGAPFSEEIAEASKSAGSAEGRTKLAEVIGAFFGSAASSFTKGVAGG